MLDRREIREHPDAVKDAVRAKGIDLDVDEILHLDAASRKLQHELNQAQARRKSSSKEFAQADKARRAELRAEHAELEKHLRALREQLAETTEKLQALMLLTPTIPWEGAPVGPDESANVTIRTHRTPPEWDFQPLDHVELLEKRGWADFARARKVSGERAYALIGDMVLLERAVHAYALDLLGDKDFTLVSVPSLVREEALTGTGQFPAHREETYAITADDLYLAGRPRSPWSASTATRSWTSSGSRSVRRHLAVLPPGSRQRRPGRARAAACPPVREGGAVRHLPGRRGGIQPLA